MANEPQFIPQPSWQLVCQLSEEVGYLRGTILGLQFADAECIDNLVVTALKQHDQLSAIRRTFSVTADLNGKKRDEAGVLR